MTLEPINKLREYGRSVFSTGQQEQVINALADEIEREIAERFMELPVDADGVPIRMGDELTEEGVRMRDAELNSRAERTCHIEWRDDSHDTDAGYERDGAYFCTACGADLPYPLQECWDDYQAGNYEKPFNYCPSCGCKVR